MRAALETSHRDFLDRAHAECALHDLADACEDQTCIRRNADGRIALAAHREPHGAAGEPLELIALAGLSGLGTIDFERIVTHKTPSLPGTQLRREKVSMGIDTQGQRVRGPVGCRKESRHCSFSSASS